MLRDKVPQSVKNIYHLFVAQFALVYYRYPARNLTIIGVTGTDGKTTTSTLIYHLLKTQGKRVALISTIGAFMGAKEMDTGLHVTTPSPWMLQGLIREIANKGFEFLVLEVTSHALDQNRVAGVDFKIGVLTNVTNEHLNYHKTFKNYLNTKIKLLKQSEQSVLNRDDKSFNYVRLRLGRNPNVVSYGFNSESDYSCESIKSSQNGMGVLVSTEGTSHRMKTSLFGNYNVSNILASVAVARLIGLDWRVVSKGIGSFRSPEGRLQKINNKLGISIYVDFAHTPNALENLLMMLRRYADNRLISVLGCAGRRDTKKRREMGKIAMTYSDVVVFTAEDPRYEDVDDIIEIMIGGAKTVGVKNRMGKKYYISIPERGKAIHDAIVKIAKPGDTVVICGKGHEKSMNYNGIEYPWSDQRAVKMALNNKIYSIDMK